MEEIKKDENQEDVKNSKNNKKELEKIKALIETQKKEIEEKDDRLKRLMAEFENFKQGIELVLKQFKDVLTSNGVTEIETIGKTFDPELHEAITSVVDENLGPQEIKEEYRKGYMIGNKVIRHSLVVVAN